MQLKGYTAQVKKTPYCKAWMPCALSARNADEARKILAEAYPKGSWRRLRCHD